MSYTNRTHDPRRRTTAIAAVIAIHAVVGYVLVTGLSFTAFEKIREYKPIFEFKDPPPEPPPPPPPEAKTQPETQPEQDIIAPPKPFDLSNTALDNVKPFDPVEVPVPTFTPKPLVLPTPAPPAFAPKRAAPRNDPARWVMTDDYPSRLIREGVEGVAGFRVVVGSDGKVDACEITASSGNAQLDEATCRYVTRRARFDPATDGNGQKTVGSYSSSVRWVLPD